MRLEKYKEAWQLLDPPIPNPPITIQACIDENYPEGYQPETSESDEESPDSK